MQPPKVEHPCLCRWRQAGGGGGGEMRGRAGHARWKDEGRVSRRQINQKTSKANGLRERRNERAPPVCPMPFPLRSAWACSQISGPLCRRAAWRGLGPNAHNKCLKARLQREDVSFLYLVSLKLWLFILIIWSLKLVFVSYPCMCRLLVVCFLKFTGYDCRNFEWNINTQSHTLGGHSFSGSAS